jgi:peptidyl-prolyl cis-trans isomerase D
MAEDERDRWLATTMQKLATGLRANRDLAAFARVSGAAAETLSFAPGTPADSLFPPATVDAIRASAVAQKGQVQGPSAFGAYSVVWRVDSVDTAWVPTFELARSRVEPEFAEQVRQKDEQEGRAWFDPHRAAYLMPVQYVADYVQVSIPPPDSVRLGEAELKAEYQNNLARYHQDEQVHARHLLIMARAGDAAAEASARARADSLLAAIRHGADFVDLARRFSQEPNASASGGDLGWFGRGRMVPDFERAAFALKAGEVSPVVKTQFGYHIIRLEGRKPAGTKPFAEVRGEIRSALATARADTSARRAALALRRALASATDPKPLAARYGGIQTTPPFAAGDAAGNLGVVPGLSDDLAKLAVGRWAPQPYRAGRGFIVLRPVRTLPSRPAEFDEVKARAIEDAKDAKRKDLLERRAGAIRTALAAGATLDSLAAPYGGTRDSGPITQGYAFVPGLGLEPRLVQQSFAAKLGVLSDTLQVSQGVAWYRVDEHGTGDPKLYETVQPQLTLELTKNKYDQWLDRQKQGLRIEVLRPELGVARPAPVRTGVAGGG